MKDENTTLQILGNNIKQIRTSRGVTQQQLGVACHADAAAILDIERGKANTDVLMLQKIAAALQVSIADLFELQDSKMNF